MSTAPKHSDKVLQRAIVSIVEAHPNISPAALRGELCEMASDNRLSKLIAQSAKWDGRKWTLSIRMKLTPPDPNPLPALVAAVKADLKNGEKPTDIAARHGVEYSMVLGVKRGRYDGKANHSKNFVKVNGMLKLYDEKGYEPSGKSIKGALETSDDCDLLRCHECGDWFENLAAHIRYEHDIRTRDYKTSHGLKMGTALIGDALRIKRIAAAAKQGNSNLVAARAKRAAMYAVPGTYKPRPFIAQSGILNLRGNCAAQLTNDLKILAARLGHVPSEEETKRAGICYNAVRYRFGTAKEALATVSVNLPAKKSGRTTWYTEEQLIEMLKAFYAKHKRQPYRSDLRRGLLPSGTTFVNHFGSLNKALAKAGMRPNPVGWTGIRRARKARKLATMSNGVTT